MLLLEYVKFAYYEDYYEDLFNRLKPQRQMTSVLR